MANKYIRHGETFCGDGTTSAAASSAGAVGAWNDINVFEGSAPAFGVAPAAGDTIYIRSKDATEADITRALTVNRSLGKSGLGTTSAPVTWVIDGGAVWTGVSGVLTYQRTSGASATLLAQNTIAAQAEDGFVFECRHAATYAYTHFVTLQTGVVLKNAWLRGDLVAYSDLGVYLTGAASGFVTYDNCRISMGTKFLAMYVPGTNGRALFINPRITIDGATTRVLFATSANGNTVVIYGGSISGAGATTGQTVFGINASGGAGHQCYGFEFPKTMTVSTPLTGALVTDCDSYVNCVGSDSGLGAVRLQRYGSADSRTDNNYPTLNATFPDSVSTPWSWRIYPSNASRSNPIELPFMKVYSDTAAAKTITLEVLVADSFEGVALVNKGSLWLDVFYIDNASGLKTYATSMDLVATANLDTSTAGWTSATWGAVACLKRKLAVTTPTAIKQDTMIVCLLRGFAKSNSAGDVVFVDPDPQLT